MKDILGILLRIFGVIMIIAGDITYAILAFVMALDLND